MKNIQTLKANYPSKNGVMIADNMDTVFPNVDNQNKPQKHKEPNKSFYQYMKKDQNLQNKNIHSNNSSGKPLPNNTNYTRNQSPYNSSYRGRSPERRSTRNSQNNYNQSNSQNNQNNYSRSKSNTTQFDSGSSSQSNPRNRHYSNNQSRKSSYNKKKKLFT